jgi:glycosyltransferase involved in cell wall biosynthesis
VNDQRLHVVMLSDHETLGGPGLAAARLAESLCTQHQVTRCVLHPDGQTHPWQTWPLIPGRPEHTSRWSRFSSGHAEQPHAPEALLRQALEELAPDVINVHNLHSGTFNGWSPELVGLCAAHAPVVWTLHDMWSFTGRCLLSGDCRRFVEGCDAWCPTPEEYPALLPAEIRSAWLHRRRILDEHADIVAVANSRWLASEARAGLWARHTVEVIPSAVPLDTFRPVGRGEARALLGIPGDGPVLLVAAADLGERRTGGPLVPHVLDLVPERPLTLITMGQGEIPVRDNSLRVLPMGWVDDPCRQSLIYSAADILLHLAPVASCPNILLESLACGTPIVSFAGGGISEIVRPGRTGWLAPAVTPEALAGTLSAALAELAGGLDLCASCRSCAEAEYAAPLQARSYGSLFASLVRRPRTFLEALGERKRSVSKDSDF